MIPANVGNATRTALDESSPSLDQALELLANERRRAVAAYLLDATHAVTVEDIADAIADAETDEACVATLHHAHLPKLAAAGVIEWDHEEYVAATPRLADLEPFLRAVADFEGQLR